MLWDLQPTASYRYRGKGTKFADVCLVLFTSVVPAEIRTHRDFLDLPASRNPSKANFCSHRIAVILILNKWIFKKKKSLVFCGVHQIFRHLLTLMSCDRFCCIIVRGTGTRVRLQVLFRVTVLFTRPLHRVVVVQSLCTQKSV